MIPARVFVVRARYVQPDGVGWLEKCDRVTSYAPSAATFASEADAWIYLGNSRHGGHDEEGPFLWVEECDRADLMPRGRR